MNKPTRIAALAAVLATAAQPAAADPRYEDSAQTHYDYAEVIDVKPLIRTVRVEIPVRECYELPVEARRERRRGGLGRVLAGGIIGGVIGRQFGDGSGRDAMTVLGSVVGAAKASERDTREREPRAQRYCETTYEYEERDRLEGFRVTYAYDGQTYTTRTETDPGDVIRVRVDVRPLVD